VPAVATALFVLPLTLASPARGDAAQDAADAAASAQQAQARAAAAAVQVDELTDEYAAASARVRQGLASLATSFSASAQAEESVEAARSGLAEVRVERGRRVRALYATGGSPTLAASVLGAADPEEALWRATTVRRVLAGLVVHSGRDVAAGQQVVTSTVVRRREADAQAQQDAETLERLQGDAATAQDLLDQAHQRLDALDVSARQATTAARAAQKLAAAQAQARAAQRAAATTVAKAAGIPAEFLTAYRRFAGTCNGLRWTLLAAVGQVESGHGRNNGPSSSGAVGPMQFMPATFASFAVDGDGDGKTDPWDPQDAIATAGRYLCAGGIDGTPDGDRRALLHYNHAQWYVDLVLDAEDAIKARAAP